MFRNYCINAKHLGSKLAVIVAVHVEQFDGRISVLLGNGNCKFKVSLQFSNVSYR